MARFQPIFSRLQRRNSLAEDHELLTQGSQEAEREGQSHTGVPYALPVIPVNHLFQPHPTFLHQASCESPIIQLPSTAPPQHMRLWEDIKIQTMTFCPWPLISLYASLYAKCIWFSSKDFLTLNNPSSSEKPKSSVL